jgi:hypothetical protein
MSDSFKIEIIKWKLLALCYSTFYLHLRQ